MLFPQCILELSRSSKDIPNCIVGDYRPQCQLRAPLFLDFHRVKVRIGAYSLWLFLWPSLRLWPLQEQVWTTAFGVPGTPGRGCAVSSLTLFPLKLPSTPSLPFLSSAAGGGWGTFALTYCTLWALLSHLRAGVLPTPISILWVPFPSCPDPFRWTWFSPEMTPRFISKLDTHTRIKDSPATNGA